VTWDGYKEGNFGEQEERKMKQGVGAFFKRKIGRVKSTCGRKPQTLF
jgi:hypothetical protein